MTAWGNPVVENDATVAPPGQGRARPGAGGAVPPATRCGGSGRVRRPEPARHYLPAAARQSLMNCRRLVCSR
ncbi:hypothetical protein G6F35_018983 [Rhizopus arrhizus]|nr:hypothetical protein G6F35_018983 [Rhizopus arrhizus]